MRKPLPIKILIIQSLKQRIEGVGYRHVNPNVGFLKLLLNSLTPFILSKIEQNRPKI